MFHFIKKLAVLLICTVGLSGCFDDSIQELVDEKFPPVDAAQYRETSISTAFASLQAMDSPDVAAVLRLDDVWLALDATDVFKKANIKDVKIEGDSQLLLANIQIDGVFKSSMFPDMDVESAALLDSLNPKLVGVLKIGASITSAVATETGANLSLDFQLLPLFSELRIEQLTVAEDVELDQAADFIAGIINRFADNISGELSRAKFTKITVPASPVGSVEVSSSEAQTLGDGTKLEVTLTVPSVSPPFFARVVAFKISSEDVAVLVDFAPTGTAAAGVSKSEPVPDFADFSAAFEGRLGELVAKGERPDATWAALSKSSLSNLMNAGFQQAKLCLDAQATVPRQEISTKIELPDETTIDCTPTKDCASTGDCTPTGDCTFMKSHDDRNCTICALWRPWPLTGCERYVNDPSCETAKALQNTLYEAEHAAKVTTCEAKKLDASAQCIVNEAIEKTACEVQRDVTKGFCETTKQALKDLSRTGNVANVDSFAQATGKLRVCASQVVFDPLLANLEMALGIEGQVDAQVGIKWTSLDVVGHATCPINWAEYKDIKVSVLQQQVDVQSPIDYLVKDESLWITANIKTSALKAELRPTPRDLILQNYSMQVSCPLLGGLLGAVQGSDLLFDASGAIPEMNGDFTFPGAEKKFEFEVEPITVDIPTTNLSGKALVRATEKSILVEVRID